MSQLEIETEKVGTDVAVATLKGRLDTNSVASAEKTLLEASDGLAQMILDLAGVDYISSAGLRVLLLVAKKLKTGKGQLSVCSVTPRVKSVLDISGFASVFPIRADRQEALAKATARR